MVFQADMLNAAILLGSAPWGQFLGQSTFGDDIPGAVLWRSAFILLLGAVIGTAIFLLYRRFHSRRLTTMTFQVDSKRVGLTKEEQDLLQCVANMAGLRRPEAIFTMDDAFRRGSSVLMSSSRVLTMSPEGRKYISVLLNSLCDKLGFHADVDSATITSSREIPVDTQIRVAHRSNPEGVDARITQNDVAELVIELASPILGQAGESWLVRYSDGISFYEFDSAALKISGNKITLTHSENVRLVNRRRFPRIPIDRPAQMAAFKFHRADGKAQSPEFVQGRLVEIAGPGLRVRSPMRIDVGEKALVIVQLEAGKAIQGLCKVRRVGDEPGGEYSVAVEMIGLGHAEISELVRATNLAVQAQGAGPAASSRPAKSHQMQEVK